MKIKLLQRIAIVLPVAVFTVLVSASTAQVNSRSAAFAPAECQTVCDYTPCHEDDHVLKDATGTTQPDFIDNPHGECLPGDCNTAHIECTGNGLTLTTPEDYVRQSREVAGASGKRLQQILNANPTQLSLNEERGALQMTGCKGAIRAMVPLSSAQLADLHSLNEQR